MVRPLVLHGMTVRLFEGCRILPCATEFEEKFTRPCLFIGLEGYAVRVEDLSKTEAWVVRLNL